MLAIRSFLTSLNLNPTICYESHRISVISLQGAKQNILGCGQMLLKTLPGTTQAITSRLPMPACLSEHLDNDGQNQNPVVSQLLFTPI